MRMLVPVGVGPISRAQRGGLGGGFGRGFQQRSIEELVKHDQGLDREPRPPRRGCGCAALPLVGLAIGIPFLSRLT